MSLRTAFLAIFLVTNQAGPAIKPTAVAGFAPASETPAIVIGFTGGFVSHDNMVHGPVQLAERLRHDLPSGTYVQVFENRHGEQARAEILRLLDAGHKGTPSPAEKQRAHHPLRT